MPDLPIRCTGHIPCPSLYCPSSSPEEAGAVNQISVSFALFAGIEPAGTSRTCLALPCHRCRGANSRYLPRNRYV